MLCHHRAENYVIAFHSAACYCSDLHMTVLTALHFTTLPCTSLLYTNLHFTPASLILTGYRQTRSQKMVYGLKPFFHGPMFSYFVVVVTNILSKASVLATIFLNTHGTMDFAEYSHQNAYNPTYICILFP